MNRLQFIIASLAFFCLMAVQADETNTQYKDCGHNEIKSFFLSGCNPNQKSCVIHKHSKTQLRIGFVANENTGKYVKTRFICNLGGIEVGWPGIDETDACQGHGLSCPLTKGQTYLYNLDFSLGDDIPLASSIVNVTGKVQLEDEHGGQLLCGKVHISLQP
ncbi:Group 22 mite allergen-like protein (lipid binding protein) [Euroglyphus maynei]|uniref:Group 22 mite allergen-like protein (Lipid binding protein) n=1 Tax=Euroglyphus maynei TaxID=6958 RepID=A0A1Y3BC86_EURMA|nr:Group 22 mite allergen-like protein (lipid binding protein) [Euroglyphus maynei]